MNGLSSRQKKTGVYWTNAWNASLKRTKIYKETLAKAIENELKKVIGKMDEIKATSNKPWKDDPFLAMDFNSLRLFINYLLINDKK